MPSLRPTIVALAAVWLVTACSTTPSWDPRRWFSRDEARLALAGDPAAPFGAPPPYAIAHTLLTAWVEGA